MTRVVVTGGATGIGAATVDRLEKRGCQVIVLDVVPPQEASAGFICCDLSDPAAIERATSEIDGPIDALVNVAGIPGPRPAEPVVAVNFLGLRALSLKLLPRIVPGGSLVIVASTAGRDWQRRSTVVNQLLDTADFESGITWCRENSGLWDRDPYTFSKQCAVAWMYRAAGLALPRGVRVNSVSPGGTQTRLTKNFTEQIGAEQVAWMNERIGRMARPDDIAAIIEFVAIGDCGWLNGIDIVADGGLSAGILGGWIDFSQSPAARAKAARQPTES
ncbi:SDR family oxidoreductase [Iodidimonas sp. SYSU 1G8]|uniref:SDR family oxidoreductase n=1 Tax=Iodidimonas sp. SYSU 1G8 TaxID=3133967 RepID=UPI0031FE5D0F